MMPFTRSRRLLVACSLVLLLFLTSCGGGKSQPSRWDNAQQQTTSRQSPTPTAPVKSGGKFNKFFPSASGEYQLVFAQEKTGFAEAKLKKGGQEVATLSINDVANNPSAADKFKQSAKKIGGYPAVDQGSTITAILVGNRYQVKAMSKGAAFTPSDREQWLQKFNLSGLSSLK